MKGRDVEPAASSTFPHFVTCQIGRIKPILVDQFIMQLQHLNHCEQSLSNVKNIWYTKR